MSASKRVFANEKDMNFNEYVKNKMGIEIIKNNKSKNKEFNYFLSYDRFILLTKTYFKYSQNNSIGIMIPTNIYNTNTSFICYQSLLSHIKDCNHCKYCKDVLNLCECHELKGILYPYGLYISKNIPNNFYLHKRFTLDDWCKTTCIEEYQEKEEDQEEQEEEEQEKEKRNSLSDCSACSESKSSSSSIINKKKHYHNYVFPSQNAFVFGNKKDKINHSYENRQRMNAFAVYPNLKNCQHCNKTDQEEEEPEKPCNKKMGMCKNTKPLFI